MDITSSVLKNGCCLLVLAVSWTIWTRTAMWGLCWSLWHCSRAADSRGSWLTKHLRCAVSRQQVCGSGSGLELAHLAH